MDAEPAPSGQLQHIDRAPEGSALARCYRVPERSRFAWNSTLRCGPVELSLCRSDDLPLCYTTHFEAAILGHWRGPEAEDLELWVNGESRRVQVEQGGMRGWIERRGVYRKESKAQFATLDHLRWPDLVVSCFAPLGAGPRCELLLLELQNLGVPRSFADRPAAEEPVVSPDEQDRDSMQQMF